MRKEEKDFVGSIMAYCERLNQYRDNVKVFLTYRLK